MPAGWLSQGACVSSEAPKGSRVEPRLPFATPMFSRPTRWGHPFAAGRLNARECHTTYERLHHSLARASEGGSPPIAGRIGQNGPYGQASRRVVSTPVFFGCARPTLPRTWGGAMTVDSSYSGERRSSQASAPNSGRLRRLPATVPPVSSPVPPASCWDSCWDERSGDLCQVGNQLRNTV